MREQLKCMSVSDSVGSEKNGGKSRYLLKRGFFPSIVRVGFTVVAMGLRILICPGDDILAATTAATLGFKNSDTPRAAVLPKPIEVIFEEEKENKDKNKI